MNELKDTQGNQLSWLLKISKELSFVSDSDFTDRTNHCRRYRVAETKVTESEFTACEKQ